MKLISIVKGDCWRQLVCAIGIVLAMGYTRGAFAISAIPYFPLAPANTWSYQIDGAALVSRVVQASTSIINGVATSVIADDNGTQDYYTNDNQGIRQHGSFSPARVVNGVILPQELDTFTPPVTLVPATFSLGSTRPLSGTATLDIAGYGIYSLAYSGNSTVVGFETISTTAGQFRALKVILSITITGNIGGSNVRSLSQQTSWLVENLGEVKSINSITNNGTETSSSEGLTASNLLLNLTFLGIPEDSSSSYGGQVAIEPLGVTCRSCTYGFGIGTTITLTPVPDAGSFFSQWSSPWPSCRGKLPCSIDTTQSFQGYVGATFVGPTTHPIASIDKLCIFAVTQIAATSEYYVTIRNLGDEALVVNSATATGDFFVDPTDVSKCAPIGKTSWCWLPVHFRPTVTGTRTGTLTITTNADQAQTVAQLAGTGSESNPNSVTLPVGWSLVGNGMQGTIPLAGAFSDMTKVVSVWVWTGPPRNVWGFRAPNLPDNGAAYAWAHGFDSVDVIAPGQAFWVNASSPVTISLGVWPRMIGVGLGGAPVPSTRFADNSTASTNAIQSGWTLLAVGDIPSPRQFVNAISEVGPRPGAVAATTLASVWAWFPGDQTSQPGWIFYSPALDNSGDLSTYTSQHGYKDFLSVGGVLGPTTGLWVNRP